MSQTAIIAVITIISTIIGFILKSLDIINKVKKFFKQRNNIFLRQTVINNPSIIMGNRGEIKEGFMRNVYLYRDNIDGSISYAFSKNGNNERNNNIIVVIGQHASGKSRAVWQFIQSDAAKEFKKIYRPNQSIGIVELKNRINNLRSNTLVVFDDIDFLWGTKILTYDSLLEILSIINEKKIACIITLTNSVQAFHEIIKTIEDDNALGNQKSKKILIVEIEDIEKDDDCFLWCTDNLPSTKYSKVIGGYIPIQSRHADQSLKAILDNDIAVVYMTSFVILKKFRNRNKVSIERISLLYKSIRNNDELKIPETPNQEQIQILFDTGMLRLINKANDLEVDDLGLYEYFLEYCITNNKKGTLVKYLSDSMISEKEQIARLIESYQDDPIIYSRIITRCNYPEHRDDASKMFIKRFFECSFEEHNVFSIYPQSIKPQYSSSPDIVDGIIYTTGIIVGRAEDSINCCQAFLKSGVKPDIRIVNGLIILMMR